MNTCLTLVLRWICLLEIRVSWQLVDLYVTFGFLDWSGTLMLGNQSSVVISVPVHRDWQARLMRTDYWYSYFITANHANSPETETRDDERNSSSKETFRSHRWFTCSTPESRKFVRNREYISQLSVEKHGCHREFNGKRGCSKIQQTKSAFQWQCQVRCEAARAEISEV